MTPVYAKSGKDCFRACLASVMEKEYEEIPFVDPDLPMDEFWEAYRKIVNEFEFEFVIIDRSSVTEYRLRVFSIGIGVTENGGDHAVVCYDGKVVHDPSSNGTMTVEQDMFLIPICPWKYKPEVKSKNIYMTEKS